VTYRFHPVGRKPINLGTDLAAALRKVLDLNGGRAGRRHGHAQLGVDPLSGVAALEKN
jgi:hypothetical protein